MKASYIYTLLTIGGISLSGLTYVFTKSSEADKVLNDSHLAKTQADISMDISKINGALQNIDFRLTDLEEKKTVWDLEDVRVLLADHGVEMKRYFRDENNRAIKEYKEAEKKKYDVFFVEGTDGYLYKIYGIETEEGTHINMKAIRVDRETKKEIKN